MKTNILVTLIVTMPLLARAEWVEFGTSRGMDYKFKTESVTTVKGRHSMIIQRIDPNINQVTLLKISVPITACKAQIGQLHTSKLNGEIPLDHDFAFGGESMSSIFAEKLCNLADIRK